MHFTCFCLFLQISVGSALADQTQRDTELQQLLESVTEKGLDLQCNVPYDGDCFFSSILKISPAAAPTAANLRANLVDFFRSDECPPELKEYVEESFLAELAVEYKDVQNDLVVKGTAVLLKTNVKVFSFDPATKSLTETIYRSRQQLCNKDTIVLGHITDKHFVPLRIKQSSMPLRKRPLSQTSMHSFFKMPRNSAHLQPPSSTSNLPTSPQVSRKTFQRPLADQVLTSSTSESSTLTGNDNESPASESSTGPRASPSASGVSSDPWPQPPSMQPEKQCQSTICCKKTNSPYQPTSDVVLAKTEVIITSKRRRLIVDWYDRYPWLHLCTTNYKAYCFMCMHANHHPGSKPNSAFVSTGFNNWKKAKDKFDEHEKSHFIGMH